MQKDKDLDKVIKACFNDNLEEISLHSKFGKDLINKVNNKNFFQKLKKSYYRIRYILNYQVEIPVSYIAISFCLLLLICNFQISNIRPDSSEIESYQLNWITNDYMELN